MSDLARVMVDERQDKGPGDGEASAYLRRPLYAFDLPPELL